MHERMVLILKESVVRINEKVIIHFIRTDKFKSNVIAAFLLTELNRENIYASMGYELVDDDEGGEEVPV